MAVTKKVLLLGSSGKMGVALRNSFEPDYEVICRNSSHFDASEFDQVESVIDSTHPDIVLNTVAFLGIDACEKEPEKSFRLNALYPKYLAGLSKERGFLLVHFSTDAVFDDEKRDYYVESDSPKPLNVYGATKYGGDCFVESTAEQYYLIRISLLFGQTFRVTQFVEKMLSRIEKGAAVLRVSDDIICSPTYSKDVAREVKRLTEGALPYGLYHVVNEGKVSLHELTKYIVDTLKLEVKIEKASYRDFPAAGSKNTCTPLRSEKIGPLRPWEHAVAEYCRELSSGKKDER